MVSPDTGKEVVGESSCFCIVLRDSKLGKTACAWGSSTSSGCRGIGL